MLSTTEVIVKLLKLPWSDQSLPVTSGNLRDDSRLDSPVHLDPDGRVEAGHTSRRTPLGRQLSEKYDELSRQPSPPGHCLLSYCGPTPLSLSWDTQSTSHLSSLYSLAATRHTTNTVRRLRDLFLLLDIRVSFPNCQTEIYECEWRSTGTSPPIKFCFQMKF